MVAPRSAPKLAVLDRGQRKAQWKGALTGSVLAHVLLIFAVSYDFSCAGLPPPALRAGGPGPRGGGGGGGGEVIGYMQLPAYLPPEETPEPEQRETPVEEMVLVIPQPQIADVQQSEVALRERQPINLAEVLGRGDGTGGGPGRGTGSGGGQGTGVGTGIGSDIGPGTGGDGGEIFLPVLRFTTLPPLSPPAGVRGREHVIRFLVSVTGDVLRIDFVTPVRDAGYRRRWLERLREYRFAPATTRAGEPIEAVFEMTITP